MKEIELEKLIALEISVTTKQGFKLIIDCETDLEKLQESIIKWSEESETKTGKSLVRTLRLEGYTAFTESQLNKYIKRQDQP